MSASQQKKSRAQERVSGADKRQIAKKEASKAAKKERRTVTAVSIVLAVVVLFLVAFNSSLLYNNFSAVRAGDVSFTASDFTFFYRSSYYNYVTSNYDYLSWMGLDTNKSLESQAYPFGEDMTWADFFKESAISSMESIAMLWTAANEAGFTLTEEQQAELDETIESFKTSYVGTDFPSANRYLAANYGKGMTVERITRLVTMSTIATAYATEKAESFTYTDEEIEAHYVEKKDDFDNFAFLSYFASGAADEENGIDAETAMATAKALADSLISDEPLDEEAPEAEETETEEATGTEDAENEEDAEAGDATDSETEEPEEPEVELDEEGAFTQRVLALTQTAPTSESNKGSSYSTAAYFDWLKDPARKYGDKTVIETDTGYYVLFFISRDGNEYETVDVRHILINAVADAEGVYTDEAKAAALQEAEDILAEWKAGDRTEDSFALLADTYSDDGGSNTNGGLYEKIYKGWSVPEFNDWSFDPARKPGDTGIVFNEGSYCGYHIMYFVGRNATYRSVLAEADMRNTDYSDWQTAQLESFTAVTGFTAFLVR